MDVKDLKPAVLFDLVEGYEDRQAPALTRVYGAGPHRRANNGFYAYGENGAGLPNTTARPGTSSPASRTWT